MSRDTDEVWAAVHKLMASSRQRLERHGNEWLTEIADATDGVCVIAAHRSATVHYAEIPSLWEQATIALEGGEQQLGRGSKPLRERSPADLDLLEIRSLIRDTTRHELEKRHHKTKLLKNGRQIDFDPAELSSLASLVIAEGPDGREGDWPCGLDFWAYRFAQWARLLETYLHAVERQAKPVRLRNSACPTCKTSQVRIDQDGDVMLVPALLVDFRDGYVRAATCEACGETWWRGPDLERLAADLGIESIGVSLDATAC